MFYRLRLKLKKKKDLFQVNADIEFLEMHKNALNIDKQIKQIREAYKKEKLKKEPSEKVINDLSMEIANCEETKNTYNKTRAVSDDLVKYIRSL